jgi:DinB superfamily
MTGRPEPNEYAPFYADYVRRADTDDIFSALQSQLDQVKLTVSHVPENLSAEHLDGKWSLREVVGHLCDAERIFAYRAFRFSRNDSQTLAGFEQDDYVREGDSNQRSMEDLVGEFSLLRHSTIATFRHITPEIAKRRGIANGAETSVRAFLYITYGHANRHLEIIRHHRYKI